MDHGIKVFDDVTSFCAEAGGLLAGRAKTDLLLVAVDIVREEPAEATSARQPSGSPQLAVHWVEGDHQLAGTDPLLAFLGIAPPSGDGPHPIDTVVDEHGIASDAVAVIYAGHLEWESDFQLTKKLKGRLPGAAIYLMACDCAKHRKIAKLSPDAAALGVAGIVFTDECGGELSMETVASAFIAASAG
ncbi:MAG TPA: hypothetical protein VL500_00120 [Candidatus Eisenbacteria bacterium]|jgi:hypothetical protein|nr:hypothetical protein [Candidatus Eisenbacteria bacterium]